MKLLIPAYIPKNINLILILKEEINIKKEILKEEVLKEEINILKHCMGLVANSFDDEPHSKYNVPSYSICKIFQENSMKINSNTNFNFLDYAKLLQVVSNAPVTFQKLIDEESQLFICEQSYSSKQYRT